MESAQCGRGMLLWTLLTGHPGCVCVWHWDLIMPANHLDCGQGWFASFWKCVKGALFQLNMEQFLNVSRRI